VTRNPILPSGAQPAPDPSRLPPRTAPATGVPPVRPTNGQPAAVEPVRPAGDNVSLSDAARQLAAQAASGARSGEPQLSADRLKEIGQRVANGFYDRPDVVAETARRVAPDLGL
jgi:hypothetical protein